MKFYILTLSKETLAKIEWRRDNNQYDDVHSIRPVQDKRLRKETELLREMLNRKELYKVDWIDETN